MLTHERAQQWFDQFQRYAQDLVATPYTYARCVELAELAEEIERLAEEKKSLIVAHYYLPPEFHEIARLVGDSLALAQEIATRQEVRVDFSAVAFMGETAKIVSPNTRVFLQDSPDVLGCSLVFGTDVTWLERWKAKNPTGKLVTYVNSSATVKALSHVICTSRNAAEVIARTAQDFPDDPILVLPDKFLGAVMKAHAVRDYGIRPEQIQLYTHPFAGYNACCIVHEHIGEHALEDQLEAYPGSELLIHPECGCAATCLLKAEQGILPRDRAFFLSTKGMIEHARRSTAQTFLVGTEIGLIYALRKAMPTKTFIPVASQAVCPYMKATSFEKLVTSLRSDRIEIILCTCCDTTTMRDDQLHIPKQIADVARTPIQRMLDMPAPHIQ